MSPQAATFNVAVVCYIKQILTIVGETPKGEFVAVFKSICYLLPLSENWINWRSIKHLNESSS